MRDHVRWLNGISNPGKGQRKSSVVLNADPERPMQLPGIGREQEPESWGQERLDRICRR